MEEIWKIICLIGTFLWQNIIWVNIIFSIVIVFFRRKEPRSVWAWLLILNCVPVVGFVLYFFLGTDMRKRRMFKLKEIEGYINEAIRRQEMSIRNEEPIVNDERFGSHKDLMLYNLEASGSVVTDDNDVTIYIDGNAKFDALIEDIRNAKKFIHMQYYIIRDDVLMSRIADALIEKAEEGVEVRLLYDAMGCRNMRKSYWENLKGHKIEIAEFFPALFRRFHLRVNYRNHRKIVVIDNEVAYVGGYNIGKEYIGLDKKFGYWRDTHLRVKGSAVTELGVRFALDWNYASRTNLFTTPWYFEETDNKCQNGSPMQIVSSGPDSTLQNIRNNYLRLINKAHKSIYIQTPYFIPDEAILTALTIAVHSGIEVNIMIPCKPDHPFVYWATYSYTGEMVMAGANCYTYQNGFLHSKGMIIDEEILCYGTANMDIRSFKLNFEVNATIYDKQKAKEMTDIFKEDLKYCKMIQKNDYVQRKLWLRIKEQFCRLLSPLL